MIAEVTLEKGVSRTSVSIMFKNKLPTPPKQSGSKWNCIHSCKSCVADGYVRCETSCASQQGLIHGRPDSSQTGSATENKVESFSKRLRGAENKFAGLQISCGGYVGMFKMLFKENKVLQYKIDKVDNEARNRTSKNSSVCLRKPKQGKGMFALHSRLKTCSTGGGLGAGFFDLCQRSTMQKALYSAGVGCPE